jgi:nucleoside-diphosphate-sugar epimerase
MNRRHLITGAQGLVGRHLAAHILAADPAATVLGIGRSPRADGFFTHTVTAGGRSRRAPVPHAIQRWLATGRYRYQSLSLSDPDSLRGAVAGFRPDCVYHLASALHSASGPELAATNIQGTASLVGALESAGARLVLGSSASVYGHPQRLPLDETHPCAPVNAYGATKLAAERVALAHGGETVIVRIFNVVGPGQSEEHVCGRLAAQLAHGRRGEPITLAVGPLGPTRDFIDVRDVAAALLVAAERAEPGSAINVASGLEISVRDVLSAMVRAANVEVRILEQGEVPAGVSRSVADVTRLQQLGFVPAYGIEQSLRDLIEWYRQLDALPPGDQRGV